MQKDRSKRNARDLEVATLGGGCFWCTEAVFSKIKGVITIEPGYSGGEIPNPTYEEVSTGKTGHAEVVQITFNPDIVSFRDILEVFFATHNPTTINRQGPDVGTQYRSTIFYHNNIQKKIALEIIEEFDNAGKYPAPIVTQVESFKAFFKAEDYHRNYFKRNPEKAYCKLVIEPKIAKLHKSMK